MKKLIVLSLSLWWAVQGSLAQQPCLTPMPTAKFRQKLEAIGNLTAEAHRLQRSKELARENCLSSAQVKEIAGLFVSDYNRLDFVEVAFPSITDKENFYEIYDAFAFFSNVMRLHDFVVALSASTPPSPPPLLITEPQFPALDYPNPFNYMGSSSCHPALPEGDFSALVREVFEHNTEAARLFVASKMITNQCLTVAQLMKTASLLTLENNRLTLAKNGYPHCFDIGNYSYLTQLFSNIPYRNALVEFIRDATPPGQPPPPPPCGINPEEFNQVMESIQKQNFNSTRVTVAKQIISARKCFKTEQIKEIVKIFSFEESKLEMAKFAYDFCIDKINYFSVNDVFSFSGSVEELSKYLQSKH